MSASRPAEEEYGLLLGIADMLEAAGRDFADAVRRDRTHYERSKALLVVADLAKKARRRLSVYRRKRLGSEA